MELKNETPQRILELMRMCHPDEKGEKYLRGEVIEEAEKRNLVILKALGWETSFGTIWKNRYTGHEETFASLLNLEKDESAKMRGEGMFHQFPFIVENWTPKSIWTDVDCSAEHKVKSTLNGWFK